MEAVARKTLDEGRATILAEASRNVILARISETERQRVLESAVCDSIRAGGSINEISEITGLTPRDIERIVSREERTYTLDIEDGLK